MTLEELENSLPNGLHDAEVQSVSVDYEKRTAVIDLEVFVPAVDAAVAEREAYRSASLIITGLQFLAIEPPYPNYPFADPGTVRIDACDKTEDLDAEMLKGLPDESFCRSFFVNEWNAFIHLAGLNAAIEWRAPVVYRKEREHYLPGETIDI